VQNPVNNCINCGIGVETPKSTEEITIADLLTDPKNSGFVLTSPNGKRWKITVNDNGDLKATPDQ
jgi:hypothetical protein